MTAAKVLSVTGPLYVVTFAVIVASPIEIPVSVPLLSTVTTAGLELLQFAATGVPPMH
jgi:hypothetical protein